MKYQKIRGQWTTDKSILALVLLTAFCSWLNMYDLSHYKQHFISRIEYTYFMMEWL